MLMFRLCIALTAVGLAAVDAQCYKFTSFNVQIFGATLMKKTKAVNNLVNIIKQQDLFLMQEIREASGESWDALHAKVKGLVPLMDQDVGPRQGKSNSKEQFGLMFNTGKFTKVASVPYSGPNAKKFERTPQVTIMTMKGCSWSFQFAIVNVHLKPSVDGVMKEMNYLLDIIAWVDSTYKLKDVLIAGDMNLGGSFVTAISKSKIKMYTNSDCDIHISDATKTTVKTSNPYDRIIACGDSMREAVTNAVPNYWTSKLDDAADLSDHYPIQADICCPSEPMDTGK